MLRTANKFIFFFSPLLSILINHARVLINNSGINQVITLQGYMMYTYVN